MRDIARRLDVSVATVSRALKNSREISEELCKKVQKTARQMGYRPNPFAISLRYNAPRTIGVVVPDIVTYFYSAILKGIEDAATEKGFFVIMTSSDENAEKEKSNLNNLAGMRVEGIITCLSQETTDYSHFLSMKALNIPLVFFDRTCLTHDFSSVISDGDVSAEKATNYLLDHGCKRVAFIGGENYLDIVKRRKHGYLEALRSHHIPIDRSLVICQKLEFESGCQATEQLLALDNPPDGILAMNDTLAFSAMEVIRRHQLRIPADISLIGYTDELHSNYVFPKLTSVCLQPQEMGRAAFELLLEKIQGKQKVRQVVVPALLQVRDSTKKG